MGLKYAIIDVETRWTSMYDMLQRLHEIKPFCIEYQDAMPDLKLSVNDWEALKDMVIIFYIKNKNYHNILILQLSIYQIYDNTICYYTKIFLLFCN